MEKKEHAARLAALQRQRRTELAAVMKAVEAEVNAMIVPQQQSVESPKKGKV